MAAQAHLMRTIKRQTIRIAGYMYIFYWAVWASRVCIVKEQEVTGIISWKIMNDLPSAPRLWETVTVGGGMYQQDKGEIGPKEAVDSISEWNSKRIKWVRMMLQRE